MELIWQGLVKAFQMLFALDPEVLEVTWLTLKVSGTATLVSVLIGVPLGAILALGRFPGRNFLVSLANFGMGLPPVVVGLWVSIFLWRSGPFGDLNIIYTPLAIIIAQAVIASPIVVSFTLAAIQQINPRLRMQLLALGANRLQMLWSLVKEAKLGLLAAVMAGFGGVVSEVGASMMVGGNIKGQTRVLTTATVMEVNKGNFDVAIALSIILLLLAYGVTALLTILQQWRSNNG
ncbi:MAG TPA: tungstate transporter permease [Syntrophomonas sp.]|nr:tungstate transporter permease [Syntrophomonas sp.]